MASSYVQDVWRDRVIAEYHSAAISAELLHWLIQTGVSPDTIDLCHRIVKEELQHAEICRDIYLYAGGSMDQIPISHHNLSYTEELGQPSPLRALSMCTRVFCCGETVAVPLFKELLRRATHPKPVAVLKQILADEAGHQYFGWDLLDELLTLMGPPAHRWIKQRIPSYIEDVRQLYYSEIQYCSSEDQQWGLMPAGMYSQIAQTCLDDTVQSRFVHRGLLDINR